MSTPTNILIVEDNEFAREALADSLDLLGYTTAAVQDGVEAADYLAAHSEEIELVLTDMLMPRMSGAELVDLIKKRYSHVRVMLMTGYPLDQANRDLLEDGKVTWMQKPFTLEILSEQVQALLASKSNA